MKTLFLHAKVGEDGVLRLNVPLGVDVANQEVRITIAPVPTSRFTKEEWSKIVDENSGFGRASLSGRHRANSKSVIHFEISPYTPNLA